MTQIKLKCVGGECDGDYGYADSYLKENDLVRVAIKIEFRIAEFEEDLEAFRSGKAPKSIVQPYAYYKLHIFHYIDEYKNETKIKFLIPKNWKVTDALRHLLK